MDGLVLTGSATGEPVALGEMRRVQKALPEEARIWVGSGATPATAKTLQKEAFGMIVGSAFQAGGRAGGGVETERVRAFMKALGRGG